MKNTVKAVADAHLNALEVHMQAIAEQLGTAPVTLELTELERTAAAIVPRQTDLVKANGYGGFQEFITAVPAADVARYPYTRADIASTSELQLLIDGNNSALDIKKALDAQFRTQSDLQAVLNYLEILQLAGLIEK